VSPRILSGDAPKSDEFSSRSRAQHLQSGLGGKNHSTDGHHTAQSFCNRRGRPSDRNSGFEKQVGGTVHYWVSCRLRSHFVAPRMSLSHKRWRWMNGPFQRIAFRGGARRLALWRVGNGRPRSSHIEGIHDGEWMRTLVNINISERTLMLLTLGTNAVFKNVLTSERHEIRRAGGYGPGRSSKDHAGWTGRYRNAISVDNLRSAA
jgi:hypothetical protein